MAKTNPFERLGEPIDDVVNAISVLVGRNGGWVSGQILRVNGG